MKKFITYDKLSKKEKRKADASKRRQWSDYGCLCPVSKVVPDKRKQADKRMCRKQINYTVERY